MVMDGQVRLLTRKLSKGLSKEATAAASGMSVRSAEELHALYVARGVVGEARVEAVFDDALALEQCEDTSDDDVE